MAHGWTLRQVAFGLPDTRSTSSMFGFSTHLHRLTSINPSTKHTQTTNGRRCLRTERGWGESSTALWLPWCSPAREALAPQDPNSSRGWHQRSPTIGTCPTVKRWDGYAAECLSLFSAPQSFACVEAVERNTVRRSSLRLLPPMLGLMSWAKWVELVVYLCPPPPPPPPLFSNDFHELFVSVVTSGFCSVLTFLVLCIFCTFELSSQSSFVSGYIF